MVHLMRFSNLILACCFFVVLSQSTSKPAIKAISPPHVLGEGPHWDAKSQTLLYVDIYGQKVIRLNPSNGAMTTAHFTHGPVGVVIPVRDKPNQMVVGCGTKVLLVTWDGKQNVTDPPHQVLASLDENQTDTRINDGKVDRQGRLWIGTMANEHNGSIASDKGTLYRIDNDLKVNRILSPVSVGNGLAWNGNNDAFYYIDSPTKAVFGFDFDICIGNISNKRVVFNFTDHKIPGVPDGMTIDTNDNLWIAAHDASLVLHVNPRTSELLDKIEVPAKKVTSVTFGGPNLDTLFVTTAYNGIDDSERKKNPHHGRIFAVVGLGVKGYPANNFVLNNDLSI